MVDVRLERADQALVLEDGVVHHVQALGQEFCPVLLPDLGKAALGNADEVVRHVLDVLRVHRLESRKREEGRVVDVEALVQDHGLPVLHGQAQLPSAHADHGERPVGNVVVRERMHPAPGGGRHKAAEEELHGVAARRQHLSLAVRVHQLDLAKRHQAAKAEMPGDCPVVLAIRRSGHREWVLISGVGRADDVAYGPLVIHRKDGVLLRQLDLVHHRPCGELHGAEGVRVLQCLISVSHAKLLHGLRMTRRGGCWQAEELRARTEMAA
mmetsp:Transcript_20165/g.58531  ORF Transcript_20165/g.58531 Transcript_20165/m.58531 type:complete len:268 (-) Transcript_20165:7-810(-)